MAYLYDIARTDEFYDNLPPLVPQGSTEADRERILNEIIDAWCQPVPEKRYDARLFAVGNTLNCVALFDAQRNEPIDLGDLVRRVIDQMPADDEQRVISIRGCRIDVCDLTGVDFASNNISFHTFSVRFGDGARFDEAAFGDGAQFGWARFGDWARFGRANFGDGARFVQAIFGSWALFDEATFGAGARFERSTFGYRASFERSEFGAKAWFERAEFGAEAMFVLARFADGACFKGARFGDGARCDLAIFGDGASFEQASLGDGAWFALARFGDGADFRRASLNRAVLSNAQLDRADLRDVRDVLFDETRIAQLNIRGNAPDPWSTLRRQYTGPWFFVHLGLLGLFFAPFFLHALALSGEYHAQTAVEQWLASTESTVAGLSDTHPMVVGRDMLRSAHQRYLADRENYMAIWVLIGVHKGWVYVAMTAVVIFYNLLRAILTFKVGDLRSAEIRSDVTPALKEYYGLCHPLADKQKYGRDWIAGLRTWRCGLRQLIRDRRQYIKLWKYRIRRASRIRPPRSRKEPDEAPTIDPRPSLIESFGLYRLHQIARVIFWLSAAFTAWNLLVWVLETRVWVLAR